MEPDQLAYVQDLLKVDVQPSQVKLLIQGKQEGKCLTSQDLRNVKYKLKASDRNGRSESELLVNTVKELFSNNAHSKVKILSDENNNVQAVCFMSGRMQQLYAEYGQVLFIDSTYKLDIEGFTLLVFLVEDGTGVGVPVMFGFVKYETIEILQSVLQGFVNSVNISVTQVIMVEKDLKMLNILQAIFANCFVLLCRFHVLRYINVKKIQCLSVSSDIKSQLLITVSALVYACNVADYDAAFENLQQCNCFEFLTYFTENWHNCKTLWCLAFRIGICLR